MAGQLDITNGHAARMRFSRFKQQMEGIPPAPRKPRTTTPRSKKPKPEKVPKLERRSKEEEHHPIKAETEATTESMDGIETTVEPPSVIKEESLENADEALSSVDSGPYAGEVDGMSLAPQAFIPRTSWDTAGDGHTTLNAPYHSPGLPAVKMEPFVKTEPGWDD